MFLEHNSRLKKKRLVPLITLSGYSLICETENRNEFYRVCQINII